MCRHLATALCVWIAMAGMANLASADTAITLSALPSSGDMTTPQTANFGYQFTVASEIWVTRLGLFDEGDNGLGYPHQIGLWHLETGELLASADVPAGQTGELIDHYRYVDVDAVQLLPDETYVIAFWSDVDNFDRIMNWMNDGTFTINSPVTIEQCLWSYGSGLAMPTGSSFSRLYGVNFEFSAEPPEPPVLTVDIDIRPWYPDPAPIRLRPYGVVPVAILSDEDFDATTVDPATVLLAGASVAFLDWCDTYMACPLDVNCDGLDDLLLLVKTGEFDPEQLQDGYAVLTGMTYDDLAVAGMDEIVLVP